MPLVRLTSTPDPFLLTCPVCGCRSWDRQGQELSCRACAVRVTLADDPGTDRVVLVIEGPTLSPGGPPWQAGR